jgi:mono/diheme cytochrome c family protein
MLAEGGSMRRIAWVGIVSALFAGPVSNVMGQDRPSSQNPQRPPLVIPSVAGQDLFGFYCATCHGADAKGKGPVAQALKTPPPDLTQLTKRSGGAFPRARVTQFVAGGGTMPSGAHGSTEMPVWGPIFLSLDPSDRMTIIRIENLVQYLESLQVK